MNKDSLLNIINKGEGIDVEFKKSKNKLNKDVFESVCAFLNRNGGHLILGVDDNRAIIGVDEDAITKIIKDFTTQCNNPLKLSPSFHLYPEVISFDDKKLIYIYVPDSSQVHKTRNRIFDRNDDGDFDVTENQSHITQLYIRKQKIFTENRVFPYATIDDLDARLLQRARIRAKNENNGSHPWFEMDDMELLKSAQLYKTDLQTGKEGITLAGILLFGKDQTILSALPYHKTDAILRRENLDRYDDRDDIRTNLLDSYDRLMAFAEKHLPDPFYLEGDVRISLRDKIFREAVTNTLIHREYSNAFPAKMIIEKHRVLFENANRANGFGVIDPESFSPSPKNPIIAGVFKEMGYADELGSGVRNLFKYTSAYSKGGNPELIEGDIFKISIPTDAVDGTVEDTMQDTMQDAMQDTMQDKSLNERIIKILQYCDTPKSRESIQSHINIKNRDYFRKHILKPLLEKGLLLMTIPDKPTSSKQKYYAKK